jgi:hypothetical protein
MYVLVGSKPIKEYHHEQSIFVEGREGHEYTVRLRNGSSDRVAFILSVDGLSVIDGKSCSDTSPGYILGAGETLDVQCYKVDDSTGAKFVFGTQEESYSAQIGKGTDNVGVIAARVFHEKRHTRRIVNDDWDWHYPGWPKPVKKSWKDLPRPSYGRYGAAGSMSGGFMSSQSMDTVYAASASNSTVPMAEATKSASRVKSLRSKMAGSGSLSCSTRNINEASYSVHADLDDDADDKLGTVFGDAMKWETEKVAFEKASTHPDASLVIYYDTKKNLEKRGVKFKTDPPPLPNPFPGNKGCEPPRSWRK